MFEVDAAGLARKLGDRPPALLVYELIQNAWDEPTCTSVVVTIIRGTNGNAVVVVEDDAAGFENIESAWTLFRDSKKAADPKMRGRFELGEKLVIACSKCAIVDTVGHTVLFHDGKRRVDINRRKRGTRFTVELVADVGLLLAACRRLIPPPGKATTVSDGTDAVRLEIPPPIVGTLCYLPTICSDEMGVLREQYRSTNVFLYEAEGGKGMLYEMGVPVCELGIPGVHADVQQRVPVDWGRQTVSPIYLRQVRARALEVLAEDMTPEEASGAWVNEALESCWLPPDAIRNVIRARFGERAVAEDDTDPEGTKTAVSLGYTVVPRNAFTHMAWRAIQDAGMLLPAGQVTPSLRPYGSDGRPENVMPPAVWTGAMLRRAAFARRFHAGLLPDAPTLNVVYVNEPSVSWCANYGKPDADSSVPRLCLNMAQGGDIWIARPNRNRQVLDLLLHEFAHNLTLDHLAHEYYSECTRLGALAIELALDEPEMFNE